MSMNRHCPVCEADLSEAIPRRDGAVVCPRCEHRLVLPKPPPREERQALGVPLQPLPKQSRIQIVEASPERLVLCIPPAWRHHRGEVFKCARGISFVLVMFLAIGLLAFHDPMGPVFVLIVGLGIMSLPLLALYRIVTKQIPSLLRQIVISLDAERLVLHTTGLRKAHSQELRPTPQSRCGLALASVDDKRRWPNYTVVFEGEGHQLPISAFLTDLEQEWLVRQFQTLLAGAGEWMLPSGSEPRPTRLAPESSPTTPPVMTASSLGNGAVPGLVVLERTPESRGLYQKSLEPSDLPRRSDIRIVRDTPELLEFSFPLQHGWEWLPVSVLTLIVGGVLVLWSPLVTPHGLMYGLPSLLWFLYFMLGRVTVSVSRKQVVCDWASCGTLLTGRLKVAEIESVGVGLVVVLRRLQGIHHPLGGDPKSPGDGCWLGGRNRRLELARYSDPELSLQVVGLILGRLEAWGEVQVVSEQKQLNDTLLNDTLAANS